MPRKKKDTSQPLGQMLGLMVPKEDQLATIKTLNGLPSIFYALLCQTDDQVQSFREIKTGFQYIKSEMNFHFSGGKKDSFTLAPDQRQFWRLMADRYLTWYIVVTRGWEHLESAARSGKRLKSFESQTPGEALIKMLKLESEGFMQPAFSERYTFSPSNHRALAKAERDNARKTASSSQKRKIAAELTVRGQGLEAFSFGETCLQICREHAKHDEALKNAITYHDLTMGSLDKEIQAWLHPRKKIRGYEWRNGTKYTTSFKGRGHGERFNSA